MKEIYPKAYFSSVLDIKIGFLIKNKIKALILDVDNTLIDYNKKFIRRNCKLVTRVTRSRNKNVYSIKYK